MKKTMSVSVVMLAVTGCATAPNWQHTSIRDSATAARQLVIDDGYCTRVANGAAPMPEIVAPESPQTANVLMTGSTHNTTTGQRTYGTYTGQVTTVPSGGFAGGFASGFASGASIGAAIAAQQERDRIHKGCMYAKGWTDTPFPIATATATSAPTTVVAAVPMQVVDPKKMNSTQIYATPKDEWYADAEEFMQFYPAYRSGSVREWLDGKVRAIAKVQPTLTGPQILLAAHKELSDAGQAAPEPIEKEVQAALAFYKGAAAGKPMDQVALGTVYTKGGARIEQNPTRSAFWTQKSAVSGNSVGQMGYGLLVFFGSGVPQDRVEGYRWVQKAAAIDADARKLLIDLESKMTPNELQQVK